MEYNADTHKQCSKCKEVKSRGEYYKRKTKAGCCPYCIICYSKSQGKYRQSIRDRGIVINIERSRERHQEFKKTQLSLAFFNALKESQK
jgi:hypothetical protein